MWMPVDHLLAQFLEDIGDVITTLLFGDLGIENDM